MTERFPIVTDIVLDQARGILLVSKGFLQFDNIGDKIQPRLSMNPNGPQEVNLSSLTPMQVYRTDPTSFENTPSIAMSIFGVGFVDGCSVSFDDGSTVSPADSLTFVSPTQLDITTPTGQLNPSVLTVTNPDGSTSSISLVVNS